MDFSLIPAVLSGVPAVTQAEADQRSWTWFCFTEQIRTKLNMSNGAEQLEAGSQISFPENGVSSWGVERASSCDEFCSDIVGKVRCWTGSQ